MAHRPKSKHKKTSPRSRYAKRSSIAPFDPVGLIRPTALPREKIAPAKEDIAPEPLKKQTTPILEGKVKQTTTLRKKATSQDSTVILIYQDEDQKFLASPQIISGKRHEPIKFTFKDFDGYNFIRVDGFTRDFVLPYAAITFTYRKKDAGNIWIFCQDIDDRHFLQKPTFVKGKVGEAFTLSAPAIRNYTLLRARGLTSGIFTYDQQVVTYFYRRDVWKEVEYTPRYLRFKTAVQSLDAPDGHLTEVVLAPGTVWQTFETITTDNEQRWYCLGGNLWVKYDIEAMELLDKKPTTLKPPASDLKLPNTITLQHNAMIDFIPEGQLVLYDKPFGQKIGTISDGQIVNLTGRIRIDGMLWFEVNGLGWTIREYLDLDP